jgi:DNA modification methylase
MTPVLEPENDPDDAPDAPAEPVTKTGDIWVMGPHRLVCGDSTMIDPLEMLMGSERADMCWTDPPYNVAYETKAGKTANDDLGDSEFRQFLVDAFTNAFCMLKPGAAIYVAHADTEGLNFRAAFAQAGFKLSGCLVWRKDSLVLGRSDYQWQHEPILYGWREGSRHKWYGGRKLTTVQEVGDGSPFTQQEDGRWTIRVGDRIMVVDGAATVEDMLPSVFNEPKPKRSEGHPTMKPVALIERMLRNNARPGDIVFDPFGGSGSTLIAAERLGMCARLCELDPGYCDVIVKRYEAYTGRKAELQRPRYFQSDAKNSA